MSYAELRCKTNFSFLQGASHPEELIAQALQVKLKALAITDVNGVYAIPKAYWCKKDHPELKLIVGAELTLKEHFPVTLLAQNRKAYGLLCRIITESHKGKEKGSAMLSLEKFFEMLSLPGCESLVAITSPIVVDEDIRREGIKALENEIKILHPTPYQEFKDIFGGRLFIPLTRCLDGKDKGRTQESKQISEKFGIPLIATNDVYYHIKESHKLQDVLMAIHEKKSLSETGFKLFSNGEKYLKSPDQMRRLFNDMPEALQRTITIAEGCTFCPSELRYTYPSEWLPVGYTAQSYLSELVWKGAGKRYKSGVPPEVEKLLKHELELIEKLRFADYFLTVYEIVDFAKEKKILCQGRGSAANSAVCYCLGITALDPTRCNLLFERFISAERGEPPDIDVDFEHERREEVIQHIYERYGRDRAAMLSAVITYRSKSAFREISKAFGIEVGTLSSRKLSHVFDKLSQNTGITHCRELIEKMSEEMKGFPRHLSIHSGGFVLSHDPLIETVPVEPARMEGRTIIQWDKYDLDYLGLIKVDVLSLGMLTAMRKTLDLVGLELHEIPSEDPQTYEMIQKTDTVGVFQIESRAQMSMLGRLLPKTFYDLVIEVAIVRPGPIVGKMVHPYLKRRKGIEKVDYPHPLLKEILERTLGIPLFQEQVMEIAIKLGGFTPGESDQLRRAIGAWRASGEIDKIGKRLMQGLIKSGLPFEFAQKIFMQIQGFAQYGFPESHSASFALLAYASAYLKCHFPAEFTCSLINSQPMGFYANHTLVNDVKQHGVAVLPIHPKKSDWDCKVEGKGIRLGWRIVNGLSKEKAEEVISTRKRTQFKDLKDFLSRTSLRSDVLHRLALGDAFICFGLDQRHSLWQILEHHFFKKTAQPHLFDALSLGETQKVFNDIEPLSRFQEDYQAYNLSAYGHPMEALRVMGNLPPITIAEARLLPHGAFLKIAGLLIVRQRPPTAKGVMFTTLEDQTGLLDAVIQPWRVSARDTDIFLSNCFVVISGVIQRDVHTVSLLVQKIEPAIDKESSEKRFMIEPDQYF